MASRSAESRHRKRSEIRDRAFQANRTAEQERQSQREEQGSTEQGQTFTATFTFSDGSSRTQEFRTEREQQAAQEFFNEGRSRGTW
jgi:hypothetical protein